MGVRICHTRNHVLRVSKVMYYIGFFGPCIIIQDIRITPAFLQRKYQTNSTPVHASSSVQSASKKMPEDPQSDQTQSFHPLHLIPMKEKIVGGSSRQYIVCTPLALSITATPRLARVTHIRSFALNTMLDDPRVLFDVFKRDTLLRIKNK